MLGPTGERIEANKYLCIDNYIVAIPMEYADYLRLNDKVRNVLVKHKVHLQLLNT
jgi:hypothetical protein